MLLGPLGLPGTAGRGPAGPVVWEAGGEIPPPTPLGEEFTSVGSFLHSFKCLLDSPTARFWQTAYAIGFLPPGLDLNAIPEPSGVVMITCNLFPRYVFIGMTEPKESPSLDDDLLGR